MNLFFLIIEQKNGCALRCFIWIDKFVWLRHCELQKKKPWKNNFKIFSCQKNGFWNDMPIDHRLERSTCSVRTKFVNKLYNNSFVLCLICICICGLNHKTKPFALNVQNTWIQSIVRLSRTLFWYMTRNAIECLNFYVRQNDQHPIRVHSNGLLTCSNAHAHILIKQIPFVLVN